MTDKCFPSLTPNVSLPKPMTALEPGSWAYDTVIRRWPEIGQRIFEENDLALPIMQRIDALIADIPEAPIRTIKDPGAPDLRLWNRDIRVHAGKNWLEPPWFFTEHYFYRRVIEAIGYFRFAEGEGLDPFSFQKKQGLEVSRVAIKELITRVADLEYAGDDPETVIELLYLDLWGNQADLSMWPAEGDAKPDHDDLGEAREFLLEDRSGEVAEYLIETYQVSNSLEGLMIDFLIDNAGFELVNDLVLADFLLSKKIAGIVRFHVKPHPTYVSDATVKDVSDTLEILKAEANSQVSAFGSRMIDFWGQNRLQIQPNFFWTSPLPGWDMPLPLKSDISQSDLVISKGDANYRRLLGDLHWPTTTPFADILAYFPAPVVALRTVKAEIACGMQPGQAEYIAVKDPNWMIDGRWGMVQFGGVRTKDKDSG
ncbi:damage-control phosphatase ARMT1 family protein [Chloroflexota bacterium]